MSSKRFGTVQESKMKKMLLFHQIIDNMRVEVTSYRCKKKYFRKEHDTILGVITK